MLYMCMWLCHASVWVTGIRWSHRSYAAGTVTHSAPLFLLYWQLLQIPGYTWVQWTGKAVLPCAQKEEEYFRIALLAATLRMLMSYTVKLEMSFNIAVQTVFASILFFIFLKSRYFVAVLCELMLVVFLRITGEGSTARWLRLDSRSHAFHFKKWVFLFHHRVFINTWWCGVALRGQEQHAAFHLGDKRVKSGKVVKPRFLSLSSVPHTCPCIRPNAFVPFAVCILDFQRS